MTPKFRQTTTLKTSQRKKRARDLWKRGAVRVARRRRRRVKARTTFPVYSLPMEMSASCTVTVFLTNLRLGLKAGFSFFGASASADAAGLALGSAAGSSVVGSGSLTARSTTAERRALTALPARAPRRTCEDARNKESTLHVGSRCVSADTERRRCGTSTHACRAAPSAMRTIAYEILNPLSYFGFPGRRPDRCGGKMERTCTLGATAAVADMADMLRGRGGATRRGTRARDVLFCRRGGRSQGGFQSSF